MGIVYVLENNVNGKIYIGQTVQGFKKRYAAHRHQKTLIGKAIRKYGHQNFTHFENEVPEPFMDDLERNLIKLYDCISPNGYNLESGGSKNKHACDETRKKMSDAQKGEKGSMFGRHHTEEWKMEMSELQKNTHSETRFRKGDPGPNKGKRFNEEWRRKLSEAKKGENNPWFGKHLPEAMRIKISEAQKGEKGNAFGKPSPNLGKHYTKNPCRMTLWNWKKNGGPQVKTASGQTMEARK